MATLNFNVEMPKRSGGSRDTGTLKWAPLITEFNESGRDSALVEYPPETNVKSLVSALSVCLRRMELSDEVKVCRRSDNVYLVRVKADEQPEAVDDNA